jgi:small subunit ribosomal protein S20
VISLANSRSAKKRIRQNLTRRLANKAYRSMVRTTVKTFENIVVDADKVTAGEKFVKVQKTLATAARKGHVHKNTVARKLSRLAKRLAAVSA